ncbi:hypothetical protein TruAng_006921 [Truncatella angustata]|nr:hypothetical protein TruAng_006921 [Truncatella angustata]
MWNTDTNHALKPETDPGPGQNEPFAFSSIPYSSSVGPPGLVDRRPLPNIHAQAGTSAPAASQMQTAAQRRENAKARRRVPTSQRKRTKLSCDACKSKRCKCLRTGPTPESDDAQDDSLTPCKNCVDTGISCVTTLPRKQRIYGSVEQLDRRYRALDAFVAGVFTDLPPDATADELVEYGRQRGIAMPDLGPDCETSKSPPTTITSVVSPTSPLAAGQRIGEDSPKYDPTNPHFLKDTSGQSYYIGPSGSLASFARIRDLIARRLRASGDPDAGRRIQHLSSESVTDTIAGSFDETSGHIKRPAPSVTNSLHMNNKNALEDKPTKHSDSDNANDPRFWVPTSKIKLPSKERADACVNAFFDHVHPNFILLHRPTFEQHYEDIWKSSSHRQNVPTHAVQRETYVSVGWLCCLYTIFILGSRSLPQDSKSLEFQRTWHDTVRELPSSLTASTLPNVCALMLLGLYFQGTNDRNKTWVYIGAACRLAIALGMHQELANEGMEYSVKELRKRVWWTLYDYEQHLCCSLGRPSAIDDLEVNIGAPDETLLQCIPNFSHDQIGHWVRLVRLQSAIRRDVHAPPVNTTQVIPRTIHYLRQLCAWREELPSTLRPTTADHAQPDPAKWRRITLLHVQYQKVLNLLTRRFLLREVESIDRDQGLAQDAFVVVKMGKICVTAAMRCVSLLVELWKAGQFNGVTSLDTYYAYLSSTQICLRLLEPSRPPSDDRLENEQAKDWRFQAHEPHIDGETSQPRSVLDLDLETLMARWNIVEDYSIAQLAEAIRRIHDLLQTVPMSGFSAKCEAISSEFGKAVGAIDGVPNSTLFGGHLGEALNKVEERVHTRPVPLNFPAQNAPLFHGNGMGFPDDLPLKASHPPATDGIAVPLPMTTAMHYNVMDYVYSGVLNWNSPGGAAALQQPAIQWDLVQPPEEWSEGNGVFIDMAANSWSWPFQGDYPHNNMDPGQ